MTPGTIIYAGGFELPDKNAAAHRVTANGKILAALGWRVVYLGTAHTDRYFSGMRRADFGENIFEEAHPESTKQWIEQMFSIEDLRKVAGMYADVKMMILYNVPYIYFLRAKKAFSAKGIKVVYDCTEWNTTPLGSLPKRLVKRLDEVFIENCLAGSADGLIVISRRMLEKYAKNPRLLFLPPLIDIDDPVWQQSPARREDVFEFCFAGSVGRDNKENLDIIVEAFARIADGKSRLRVIGITAEDFRTMFPEKAETAGKLGDNIVFMGRVPHAESVSYVLGCDCYIFIRPSNKRNNAGFPTKFVEATTCGAPLITTDVSDIRGYITDSCVILDKTDPDGIARAMKDMIGREKGPRSLSGAFCYKNYIEQCREWLESF